jgi:hypothetical protein
MPFAIRPRQRFPEDVAYDRALEVWRDAEGHVRTRWQQFLAADGQEARGFAFAAYVVALELEAAAAVDLAALVPVNRAA